MNFIGLSRSGALPCLLAALLGAALPAPAAVTVTNTWGDEMNVALEPQDWDGKITYALVDPRQPDRQVGEPRTCLAGDLASFHPFPVPTQYAVRITVDQKAGQNPSLSFIVEAVGTVHAYRVKRSLDLAQQPAVETLEEAPEPQVLPQPFQFNRRDVGHLEFQPVEGMKVTTAPSGCCVIL